ncbi:MAG: putative small lipoprotein YifL [Halioglobus sp.]|jgi:predicted small lipoprotein YifL
MHRLFTAIIAAGFLFAGLATLGGCGQMGPLYLPDSEEMVSDPQAQAETIPATVPAPEHVKPAQPVPVQ